MAQGIAGSLSQAVDVRVLARPAYWEEASRQLMKRDRILRKLIPLYGQEALQHSASPFMTLARAIVGQQVALRTADAIWLRLVQACGDQLSPETVLSQEETALRELGLPKRKVEYIRDLALHFNQRKIKPETWGEMADEAVITELCAIRGVGRWTAEMFLIFNLHRPNVLPLDDAGLLKAISQHYFSGEPVSRFEAREVAQAWAPWCTVATWHLWRSLDTVAVRY